MFYLRSYGKLGENVLRYSNTIIGDDKKLQKMNVSPFFKHENYLEMENGESLRFCPKLLQEMVRTMS